MSFVGKLVVPLGLALRRVRAGVESGVAGASELRSERVIDVTSPSFGPGERMPKRHNARPGGENASPALNWSALPEGTRRILLVIEDTDVPLPRPIVHTTALFEPVEAYANGLPEGALTIGNLRVQYVPGLAGRRGYQGPAPLPGHGAHHYGFHLYALDTVPEIADLKNLAALIPLLKGHVLAAGELVGWQKA